MIALSSIQLDILDVLIQESDLGFPSTPAKLARKVHRTAPALSRELTPLLAAALVVETGTFTGYDITARGRAALVAQRVRTGSVRAVVA